MSAIILVSECSVNLIQHAGSDSTIAGAAWVSASGIDAEERLKSRYDQIKLINFLMSHRHGTPFEHNSMTFRVDAPIFVWREFHRHRIGWSYNETSGRYKALEPRFWVVPESRAMVPEPGYKATQPKFVQAERNIYLMVVEEQINSYKQSYAAYERMLAANVAKEVARSVLPVAIMSQCWCTCNARSLMAYLSLRTHDKSAKFVSHPQAEIEEVARKLEAIFAELFPITYQSWCENGRVAP